MDFSGGASGPDPLNRGFRNKTCRLLSSSVGTCSGRSLSSPRLGNRKVGSGTEFEIGLDWKISAPLIRIDNPR